MFLAPARSEENVTRSKRVLLVTLIVTVPRSESRRRKVRLSRLTETTVPSYSRVAAEAAGTPAARVATATRAMLRSFFMTRKLTIAVASACQSEAKVR